jgi:hypothetical protein
MKLFNSWQLLALVAAVVVSSLLFAVSIVKADYLGISFSLVSLFGFPLFVCWACDIPVSGRVSR